MTPQEFRGKLQAMGLSPRQPTYGGARIYEDRSGEFVHVPDPNPMTAEQRSVFIELLMGRNGYTLDN